MNMMDIKKTGYGIQLWREDVIKFNTNCRPKGELLGKTVRELFHETMSKYDLTDSDKKLLARQMDAALLKRGSKTKAESKVKGKVKKAKKSPNSRKYKKTPHGKILIVDHPTPIPASVRKNAKFVKAK